jgi:hypothetical protein
MRRINPKTNQPFKQGDVREDGFIFWGYKNNIIKQNGYFSEQWCSPINYDKKKLISKKYVLIWKENNPEKVKQMRDKHYKTSGFQKNKEWQQNNKEKVNSYQKKYLKNNKEKFTAKSAKRRSAKLKRTPPWLTDDHLSQIRAFYTKAKQLSVQTGIVHHVDHIVPLQGETVSGLHVPWNLQVLTQSDNCSKSNRLNDYCSDMLNLGYLTNKVLVSNLTD